MNKLWFFCFRWLWVLKEKPVICHLPGENEVADWDQTEHRSAFNGGHHCFFSDICSMEFQTTDLYLIKTWDGSYNVSEIILK